MKKPVNKLLGALLSLLLFILLIVVDQVTKNQAVLRLKDKAPVSLIDGVFRLEYVENRGAAFGILQNQQWVFLALAGVFLLVCLYVLDRMPLTRRMLPLRVDLVLLAAGAVGNVIDRVAHTYVIDFFSFHLINFPVFNMADIYITCSAFELILLIGFIYKDEEFDFLRKKESV